MADPNQIVGRIIEDILRAELDRITEGFVIASPDGPGFQLCPKGSATATLKISARVFIKTRAIDVTFDFVKSNNYLGNGRFRIRTDRKIDSSCTTSKGIVQGTLQTSDFKITRDLASLLVADARLEITARIETLTYHFQIFQCPRLKKNGTDGSEESTVASSKKCECTKAGE